MITADPGNRFVLATDLGQDRIYTYRFDVTTGKLGPTENAPFVSFPSGEGPRHFVFHPNGRWVYALGEESSTIVFFAYDATRGALELQQSISSLPAGFAGTSFTSEVVISPDGRFLYAANRLHDTIAICSIGRDGRLKFFTEASTMGDIRDIAHSIQAATSSMSATSAVTISSVSKCAAKPACSPLPASTPR